MLTKKVYSLYLEFERLASLELPGRSAPLGFDAFESRWLTLGSIEKARLLKLYVNGSADLSDDELEELCEGRPIPTRS